MINPKKNTKATLTELNDSQLDQVSGGAAANLFVGNGGTFVKKTGSFDPTTQGVSGARGTVAPDE